MLTYRLIFQLILGTCLIHVRAQWRNHNQHTRFWPRPLHTSPEVRTIPRTPNRISNQPSFYHGISPPIQGRPGSEFNRVPVGSGPRHPMTHSSQTSSTFLSSILDPFGIFSSRVERPEARRTLIRKVGEAPTTTTEAPPPMVYFPDGGDGACEDFNPSGFNTYSFMSFMFSVANLVGLVANNVNNNLNNNNNNNNDNNNNLGNINIANSNSAQNNENTVTIPPGMGRRRRDTEDTIMKEYEKSLSLQEGEEVTALVAMDFIRGMKTAMLTSEPECALRNLCETNFRAVSRGNLSEVIAEVFSVALVDMYPKKLPAPKSALLSAGSKGRQNSKCKSDYPSCSDAKWHQLTKDFDFNDLILEIPSEELPAVLLGLTSADELLRVTSFTSNVDAMPGGRSFVS